MFNAMTQTPTRNANTENMTDQIELVPFTMLGSRHSIRLVRVQGTVIQKRRLSPSPLGPACAVPPFSRAMFLVSVT